MKTYFLKTLSPFTHIVEVDEKYYLLFNFSNLSVVRIEKNILKEIEEYLRGYKEELPEKYKEILIELEKRGFITTLPTKDIEKYKRQVLEYIIQRQKWQPRWLTLWIHITSRCNFACPYCYLVTKPGKDIELENIVAVINFIKKRLQENLKIRNVRVIYSGGEPLLRFDLIQALHEALIKLSEDFKLHYNSLIITNGSLLSHGVIEKLNTYSVLPAIQVTIDGTEETHNKFRPFYNEKDSFHEVYNNFLNLVRNYKGRVILRSNISNNNVESVKKLLYMLRNDLGNLVNKVTASFAWILDRVSEYIMPFPLSKDNAEILLMLYELAISLGFDVSPQLLMLEGPCMAVNSEGYVIDESLKVYKCPALVYTEDYFGYIERDGELRVTKNYGLIRFLGDFGKCYLNCEYGPLCFGGCRAYGRCYVNWFKVLISPRFINLVRKHDFS